MNLDSILFYLYALIAVLGAVGVVAAARLVHAVMSLLATLVAIAALFLLLGTELLAAVQLFVYGGAITVLVLFALMLSRPSPEILRSPHAATPWIAGTGVATLLITVVIGTSAMTWDALPERAPDTAQIAREIFGPYLLSFEVIGLLLTVALVGAVVLARSTPQEAEEHAGLGSPQSDDAGTGEAT